jgi:hypothetical protein
MSKECWCNDNDREKPKNLEKTLSQYHSVHHTWKVPVSTLGICGKRLATAQPPTCTQKIY